MQIAIGNYPRCNWIIDSGERNGYLKLVNTEPDLIFSKSNVNWDLMNFKYRSFIDCQERNLQT